MLTTVQFVPGAVTSGQPINLPSWAPKIDAVSSAYLIRPTSQISITNHPAHAHDLLITGGQAAGDALQVSGGVIGKTGAGNVTAAGGTSNIQNAAAMTHSITGGDPVVSATPTKVDEDTVTLNVNTQAGDILVLTYIPVGARLRVA